MHFNNLVTVKDIPPVQPKGNPFQPGQDIVDNSIMNLLELLFKLKEKQKDNFMITFKIGELNAIRNEFSRRVCEQIPQIMEPTYECTDNPLYLVFYNVEENYKEDFCTKKEDCVKFADGKIRPLPHWDFEIKDGLVYQKHAGPLKHSKRTKKAKRMMAMPDYPLSKAFKSLGEYLEYLGYEFDEKNQAYGQYANPNGYWDWYALGGRWPAAFLVSESCHEYGVGNIDCKDSERLKAPQGYQWVAMARKKDINWKLMYREHLKWSMERFRAYRECFRQQKLPARFIGRITDDGIAGFDDMVYINGESMYENLVRRGIVTKTKFHANFYGFLSENGWVDHGFDEDPKSDYIQKLDAFIDSLDDETVLVAVDCHS